GVPPELEDCRRRIEALNTELGIIGREEAVGINADHRRKAVEEKLAAGEEQRAALEERWNAERGLVERILEIRAKLRKGSEPVEGTGSKLEQAAEAQKSAADAAATDKSTSEERPKLLDELAGLQEKLTSLQGESPLILPSVDEQAVGSVVQDWTGVPVGRMVKNEIETVVNLADTLNRRVIGQRHGLDRIARG